MPNENDPGKTLPFNPPGFRKIPGEPDGRHDWTHPGETEQTPGDPWGTDPGTPVRVPKESDVAPDADGGRR